MNPQDVLNRFSELQADCGNHELYGKRRYRRGKTRCQVCGGFLLLLRMAEFDALTQIHFLPKLREMIFKPRPGFEALKRLGRE